MSSFLRTLTIASLCFFLLPLGCSKKNTIPPVSADTFAVTCVGVLPVLSVADFDDTLSTAEEKQLRSGVRVLDGLLKKQFSSRSDIRLVSDGQISGMDVNLPAQPLARALVIAERLSCNAVLETTMRRYKDRVGGQYTAKEPASVAFDYRLIAMPEGTVLCSGTFDEVQKSVMENLFNIKAATERGFTWVTAVQLMREGLRIRFEECPYLSDEE